MLNEVGLQELYCVDIGMRFQLRVPSEWVAIAMAVKEYHSVREVVVVVNNILEVDVAFTAFVFGHS